MVAPAATISESYSVIVCSTPTDDVTVRADRSMVVTSPRSTSTLSCRLRISRVAGAISPCERSRWPLGTAEAGMCGGIPEIKGDLGVGAFEALGGE